ncbi:MAG: hypothetical protein HWD61_06065 [Parachlamydiaceae bacterium]|nr:MAG: hypothetical protein HWD61_06065 [Parachlamydiaceae bacterium]
MHQVSGSGIQGHSELLQRNQLRTEKNEDPVQVIPLTDIFKSCMEQVQDLRKICTNIKEVMQTKRAHFLENLYDKNAGLTVELEKFFNLSIEQQDSYRFIRLLVPF